MRLGASLISFLPRFRLAVAVLAFALADVYVPGPPYWRPMQSEEQLEQTTVMAWLQTTEPDTVVVAGMGMSALVWGPAAVGWSPVASWEVRLHAARGSRHVSQRGKAKRLRGGEAMEKRKALASPKERQAEDLVTFTVRGHSRLLIIAS